MCNKPCAGFRTCHSIRTKNLIPEALACHRPTSYFHGSCPEVARRSGNTLLGVQKSIQKRRRGCADSNSALRPSLTISMTASPRTRHGPLIFRCTSKGGRGLNKLDRVIGGIATRDRRLLGTGDPRGVCAERGRDEVQRRDCVRNPWRFFRPISWRQERGARNGELHSGKKRWLEQCVGSGHLAGNRLFQNPRAKNPAQWLF